MKREKFKNFVKKNAPLILQSAATVISLGAAVYYMRKANEREAILTDAYGSTIWVGEGIMQHLELGKTLKHRQYRDSEGKLHTQSTTNDKFPEDMDEVFRQNGGIV